jgi:Tfp pilus assembly protein PilN
MKNMEKIRLNLASRPLRNTRFYRACLVGLAFLLIVLAFLAGFFFIKYGFKDRRAKSSLRDLEGQMQQTRAEETRFKARADAAAKAEKGRVDLVNSIIFRKSFSWNAFLSQLEGALPDPSYITSLAPSFVGEASLDLRIKVVSRSLDDLLALINNLSARNFKRIRVENESADERGQLISEITFSYERTL